jgi:hypothetical protein
MKDAGVDYAVGTVLGATVFDERLDRFIARVGDERMRALRKANPFDPKLPPIRNGAGETVEECVRRRVLRKDGLLRSEKWRQQVARGAAYLAGRLRGEGDVALSAFYESVAADIRRTLAGSGDA